MKHLIAVLSLLLSQAGVAAELPPGTPCLERAENGLVRRCDDATPAYGTRRVKVIAGDTRSPLGDVQVWSMGGDVRIPFSEVSPLRTADDGSAIVALLPSGAVRFTRTGFAAREIPSTALEDGQTIVLVPAPPISVTFSGASDADDLCVRYRIESGSGGGAAFAQADVGADEPLILPSVLPDTLRLELCDERYAFVSIPLREAATEIALAPAVRVSGIVLDEDGDPVEGANVRSLLPVDGDPMRFAPIRALSDAEGRFVLGGLPRGFRRITVTHPAYSERVHSVDVRKDTEIELHLKRAQTAVVRASCGGREIEQFIVASPAGRRWEAVDGSVRVTSDDTSSDFVIRAEGCLPSRFRLSGKENETVHVDLDHAPAVRFALRDSFTGAPVTSVRAEFAAGGRRGATLLENERGEFRFVLAGPGLTDLTLHANGYRPAVATFDAAVVGMDLGDLLLDRGASVAGRFFDAAEGGPIAGVRIRALPSHHLGYAWSRLQELETHTETDAEGVFELSGFAAERPCVVAEHPAFGIVPLPAPLLEEGQRVDLGGISPVRVPMVRVVVRNSLGELQPDVAVELRAGALSNPCHRFTAVSTGEGRFRALHVPEGVYHLAALRQNQVVASERVEISSSNEGELELVIEARRITGQVLINGVPVTGGVVELRPTDEAEFSPMPISRSVRAGGASSKPEWLNDIPFRIILPVKGDGGFDEVVTSRSGDFVAKYSMPDLSEYRTEVRLEEEERTTNLPLRFEGNAIRGRATLSDGTPAALAGVIVRNDDVTIRTARASADGLFTITAVPEGSFEVEGVIRDLRGRTVITVGDEDVAGVEVRLASARTPAVEFLVETAGGEPLGGAVVLLTDGRSSPLIQQASIDGRVKFSAVRQKTYRVLFLAPPRTLHDGGTVAVSAADQTLRRLRASDALGRVILKGSPDDDARRVRLLTADGYPVQPLLGRIGSEIHFETDGTAELPLMAAGRWAFRIDDGITRALEVREGDVTEIELD